MYKYRFDKEKTRVDLSDWRQTFKVLFRDTSLDHIRCTWYDGQMTNYGQNHDSFEACEHYVVPHLEVEGIMYVASERRWLV